MVTNISKIVMVKVKQRVLNDWFGWHNYGWSTWWSVHINTQQSNTFTYNEREDGKHSYYLNYKLGWDGFFLLLLLFVIVVLYRHPRYRVLSRPSMLSLGLGFRLVPRPLNTHCCCCWPNQSPAAKLPPLISSWLYVAASSLLLSIVVWSNHCCWM